MGFLKIDYSTLMPHLTKDEEIMDSISGDLKNTIPGNEKERKGLLTATDKRLIFQEKGDKGQGVISFPYSQLSECVEGGGYTGHPFEFTIGGKTYEMAATRRGNVRRMVSIVKAQLSKIRSEANIRPVHSDVYADIEKLTELKDKGMITPEEYETKRKELLTRI